MVEASEEVTRGGVQPVARAAEVVVQAEHGAFPIPFLWHRRA
ncbi:MAG: hypothetical protein ACXVY3_01100 [Gaiellaceae bacterium]